MPAGDPGAPGVAGSSPQHPERSGELLHVETVAGAVLFRIADFDRNEVDRGIELLRIQRGVELEFFAGFVVERDFELPADLDSGFVRNQVHIDGAGTVQLEAEKVGLIVGADPVGDFGLPGGIPVQPRGSQNVVVGLRRR